MRTITVSVEDTQPGDVLHVIPQHPNLRRIITSLYALDANTVVLHLEGLGAHPFGNEEQVIVDRYVEPCSGCRSLVYPTGTLIAAARGELTIDPTPTHACLR